MLTLLLLCFASLFHPVLILSLFCTCCEMNLWIGSFPSNIYALVPTSVTCAPHTAGLFPFILCNVLLPPINPMSPLRNECKLNKISNCLVVIKLKLQWFINCASSFGDFSFIFLGYIKGISKSKHRHLLPFCSEQIYQENTTFYQKFNKFVAFIKICATH